MAEIISDYVGLERFERLHYAVSCENCSHFDAQTETCTFAYPTRPHLKRNQLAQLQKDGRMAFCRAIEID